MSVVKESICSRCVHLSICKYKDEMLATIEHFDEYMANSRFSYVISCKDYMMKSSVAFRDVMNQVVKDHPEKDPREALDYYSWN